jgi:hypothetical protein
MNLFKKIRDKTRGKTPIKDFEEWKPVKLTDYQLEKSKEAIEHMVTNDPYGYDVELALKTIQLLRQYGFISVFDYRQAQGLNYDMVILKTNLNEHGFAKDYAGHYLFHEETFLDIRKFIIDSFYDKGENK